MRQVQQIMGMPISIDIPNCSDDSVFVEAFRVLRQIDERFSPYKPTSELSAYQNNALSDQQLSADFKNVIEACEYYQNKTNGYFSAYYAEKYDPSGYVKGWAIQQVQEYLQSKLLDTFMINAGGDIVCASVGKYWSIGVQNPLVSGEVIATISAKNLAIATSGIAERGLHVYDPHTKQPVSDIESVTVIGEDIIEADVLATTLLAMGRGASQFIESWNGYEALIVFADTSVVLSSNFTKLVNS